MHVVGSLVKQRNWLKALDVTKWISIHPGGHFAK